MSTVDNLSPPPPPALVEEKEEQPPQKEDEAQIPPPTQHQPLGLQDTCVKTLARHLEVFARPRHRYRVIPVDLFLRILRGCHSHAWVQAADTMLRVVRIMPCLDAPEVDDLYWKTVCELTLSPTMPITMPYPILVNWVVELTKALEDWMAAAATRAAAIVAAGARQEESQRNGNAEAGGSARVERKEKQEKEGKCVAKEERKGEKDMQQGKSSKKDKSRSSSPTEEEGNRKTKREKKEKKESQTTSISSSSEKEKKRKRGGIPRSADSSSSSRAKTPNKQQQQQEDQASAAVLRLLRELSRLPMSVQLLKDAKGVGDAVRQLGKMRANEGGKEGGGGSDGDVMVSEEVARAAIKLRRQWKALVQQEEEEKVGKKEEENGKGKQEEEEKSEDPMGPVGARALAALTWRDVYIFSLEYEEHRRGWIGKRALALAEDHESKKRRTRGIEENLGDAAMIEAEARKGKPPVGNTDRIRKLIKYKPMVVENKKRPFGGIAFVAPQKKKNLKVVKLR